MTSNGEYECNDTRVAPNEYENFGINIIIYHKIIKIYTQTKQPIKIQHSLSVYLQLASTVVFCSAKYSLHYKDTVKAAQQCIILLKIVQNGCILLGCIVTGRSIYFDIYSKKGVWVSQAKYDNSIMVRGEGWGTKYIMDNAVHILHYLY